MIRAGLIGLAFLCVTPTLFAQSARDRAVEVKAVDFAFTAPDTLSAGAHRWSFVNNGSVRHEFLVVRLPAEVSAEAELLTRDRRGDRLLVFCQLREAPEKPKHDEMGMFKVIYIK